MLMVRVTDNEKEGSQFTKGYNYQVSDFNGSKYFVSAKKPSYSNIHLQEEFSVDECCVMLSRFSK